MTDADFLKGMKITPDSIPEAKSFRVSLHEVLIEDGCITMSLDDLWAILEGGAVPEGITKELLAERTRQQIQIAELLKTQSRLIRQRDGAERRFFCAAVGCMFAWLFTILTLMRAAVPWFVRWFGS